MGKIDTEWRFTGESFTRCFVRFDPKENANRKWHITFTPSQAGSLNGSWFVEYGRVGKTMRRTDSKQGELYDVIKKIDAQLRDGYNEVQTAASHVPQTITKVAARSSDPAVDKLLKWAGVQAQSHIATYLRGSVEDLSNAQVIEGQEALDEIATNGATLHRVTNFFNIILTQMPRKIDPIALVSNFDVSAQQERLDQLSAAVGGQPKITGAVNSLPYRVEVAAEDVRASVTNYLVSTARGARFKIEHVYRVHTVDEQPFNACAIGNVQHLIHGTKPYNVQHILAQGFSLKHASRSGMFGAGWYGANEFSKSLGYVNWQQGLAPVFICSVRLGRQKKYQDACAGLRRAPDGYDSVWGQKGKTLSYGGSAGTLLHDEFIVYAENQVCIRALALVSK